MGLYMISCIHGIKLERRCKSCDKELEEAMLLIEGKERIVMTEGVWLGGP